MFTSVGFDMYFFAALMLFGSIFVFSPIPATKNIPLEAVERLLEPLFKLKSRITHHVVWKDLMADGLAIREGLADGGMEKNGTPYKNAIQDKV
jgi:hypothetical protein